MSKLAIFWKFIVAFFGSVQRANAAEAKVASLTAELATSKQAAYTRLTTLMKADAERTTMQAQLDTANARIKELEAELATVAPATVVLGEAVR